MFKKIKSMLAGQGPRPAIGDVILVGQHFWIREDVLIGFTPHALHGHVEHRHDLTSGSAEFGCSVKIIDYAGATHVVAELERTEMPYGSAAPIGTVFYLSIKQLNSWSVMRDIDNEVIKGRDDLMKHYYKDT